MITLRSIGSPFGQSQLLHSQSKVTQTDKQTVIILNMNPNESASTCCIDANPHPLLACPFPFYCRENVCRGIPDM